MFWVENRTSRVLIAGLFVLGLIAIQNGIAQQSNAAEKQPCAFDIELFNRGAEIAREGEKTVFSTVIRFPPWLCLEDRADPAANYDFYYSFYHERHFCMKWAEKIDGPWTTFNLGDQSNGKQRWGVFDVDACPIRMSYRDLAAPDVLVDDGHPPFIMFHHGEQVPAKTRSGREIDHCHIGFVATSSNGFKFFDPLTARSQPGGEPQTATVDDVTRDTFIVPLYQSGFWHNGNLSSFSQRGLLCEAPGPHHPWAPNPTDPLAMAGIMESTPSDHRKIEASKIQDTYDSPIATFFASTEFVNHPSKPQPSVRIRDNSERFNHLCCSKLPNDQLEILLYFNLDLLDCFIDNYRFICEISDPDFQKWFVARDEQEQDMFDVVCTPEQIRNLVVEANQKGCTRFNTQIRFRWAALTSSSMMTARNTYLSIMFRNHWEDAKTKARTRPSS